MVDRLRVAFVATGASFVDPLVMLRQLTCSLTRKGVLERTELASYRFNDFPSLKDFEAAVAKVDVLISEPHIFEQAYSVLMRPNSSIKFVQTAFAGCEKLMRTMREKKLTPPVYPVARMAGKFGPHMAEYVIAQIINYERRYLDMYYNQKAQKDTWKFKYLGYRQLSELTIGILGLGDIGHEVAQRCKSFGMTIWGVTRSPVPMEKRVPYVNEYRLMDQLEEFLAASDYVCSILPSTPETAGLLDKDAFNSCANKKTVFVNIGRGDVVSESILVDAIKNGRLAGAILDVFATEPLPCTSELWELDNVVITPHVAAITKDNELADLAADQIERYLEGKPLLHLIDWEKGY